MYMKIDELIQKTKTKLPWTSIDIVVAVIIIADNINLANYYDAGGLLIGCWLLGSRVNRLEDR